MSKHDEWRIRASAMARKSDNPIRQLVEGLKLEPHPGKPMIALSIGDPTIFGNLKPPSEVLDALIESVSSQRYNGYAPSAGHEEARAAVANYSSHSDLQIKPKDVILCSGCSSALDICVAVIADPGKNILIPSPGFPLYKTLIEGLGIEARYYKLQEKFDWEIDLKDLERNIDESTAAIIVNNPSNPCGSVYSKEHLISILEIAKKYHLPIIADEIYEHLVFEGEKFIPMASLSDEVPILSCSGLTKRFLIPGWRMGWVIIHDKNEIFDKQIRGGLQKLTQRTIGSSTLIQGALPHILSKTPEKFYTDTISVIQRNAQLVYKNLSQIEGLKPIMPRGAMYMMVRIDLDKFPSFNNGLDFVTKLVSEESCFCLPGECFNAPGYVRLTLSPPGEMLQEACTRIAAFCKQHCVL
ncbi:unnamed protein product [Nezara viridula]|uniref:Tyrosine aminotransferase n=1 Tax=Nezara viridula TaxID=85310 RepID=A0A9P0H6W8_NEZVI|nr:unnamed protein product [Nezara viridula]